MPNLLSKLREKPVKIDLDEKLLVPDFRDIQRIPPDVGIFDEPTRCYRINVQWAKIVMGWVKWLATMSAWVEAENDLYPAIAEILRFTIGEDCLDFQLRQSPTDNCILEQSLDGGDSWSPVFDFSLCDSIVDNSTTINNNQQYIEYFENVYQEIYNDFITNYVSSPSDVHSELSYGTGSDTELDAAYCNAVYTLVSVSCDVAIQGIQGLDEGQDKANVFLALAGFVLTGIAIAGALPTAGTSLIALAGIAKWWGPIVGITGVVANNLYDQWQASQISQYQDEAAQFEVTCYIVDNLPGDQNTQAAMLSTLQNHTLTGNAAVIADNLAILLEADATYAAFLQAWNVNLEFAEAGIELFCPCTSIPCVEYDFTVNDGGWIVRPDVPGRGEYISGQGWISKDANGIHSVYIIKDFTGVTIERVELEGENYSASDFIMETKQIQMRDNYSSSSGQVTLFNSSGGNASTVCTPGDSGLPASRNWLTANYQTPSTGSVFVIRKIRVFYSAGAPTGWTSENCSEGC